MVEKRLLVDIREIDSFTGYYKHITRKKNGRIKKMVEHETKEEQRRSAKVELLRMAAIGDMEGGKKKILGLFSIMSGYSIKRLEIYLHELEDEGLLHVEGNDITFPPLDVKTGQTYIDVGEKDEVSKKGVRKT